MAPGDRSEATDAVAAPGDEAAERRLAAPVARRRSVSITAALAASIGLLVAVSVLSVLALGIWSARENTLDLLQENAKLGISAFVRQIEQNLEPARDQLAFLADAIAAGEVRPEDEADFARVLYGAVAATPQIRALVFIDARYQLIGIERLPDAVVKHKDDYSGDQVVRQGVDAARRAKEAVWSRPLWRDKLNETILNLRQPVRRNGAYLGILVAAVGVRELSAFIGGLEGEIGSNAFILYDRDHVLAHANLAWDYPGLSAETPLPALASFGDPVLSAIWDPRYGRGALIDLPPPLHSHRVAFGNRTYVFVYQELAGYSDKPWIVGSYFRDQDVGQQIDRLRWAAVAGAGALLLSIALAVLFGHRLAAPVVRLSRAARRIRALELEGAADLPRSRIRELDEQATTFNTMVRALEWFETYVPKTLVTRLMRSGESAIASESRDVTVMFTDIAGFSKTSENAPAADIARFLNQHFAMLARCVEAEGGTVDKFMGDALMAFWGAPERQKRRAIRACRAALAIAAAVEADNAARRAAGKAPVRLRIGIHSGQVTVGNIGAPGRLNYTIVGDTVNIGQRLEALGKQLVEGEPDAAILISGTTAAELDESFAPVFVGRQQLRGRGAPIDVYRLLPPGQG